MRTEETAASTRSHQPLWVVGVGASGSAGVGDLKDLLSAWPAWPASSHAALMVVLHRPADRPSALREVLQRASRIPVIVAYNGARVTPGVCYLGEPAAHLTLDPMGRVDLTANSIYRNRTIDLLFHSLARNAAPHAVGVILSGSLDDGSSGLAGIAGAGGLTMAVSPDGVHGGEMPDNAARRCGGVDFRGAPCAIAAEIGKRIGMDAVTA